MVEARASAPADSILWHPVVDLKTPIVQPSSEIEKKHGTAETAERLAENSHPSELKRETYISQPILPPGDRKPPSSIDTAVRDMDDAPGTDDGYFGPWEVDSHRAEGLAAGSWSPKPPRVRRLPPKKRTWKSKAAAVINLTESSDS